MSTIVYDHQIFTFQEFGGISRYFCELASRIHRLDDFAAKIVAPLHRNAYLPDCHVPQAAVHLRGRFRGQNRLCNIVSASLSPALIWASKPSLVHRTYFWPSRNVSHVPVVHTVYDMIHELFPDSFSPDDPVLRNKRACVDAAHHLICLSESTANDLVRLFDVPRTKISVIYLGYSDIFSQPHPAGDTPLHPRPYLLHVGQRDGYKNFRMALQAYAASPQLRAEFDFVAFGGPALSAQEQALIRSLPIRAGSVVHMAGSDADLARAYRHARAFVYPSKYEGFGIPPLEAMSSGCVVASSNASSIPEVVGDAAAMFNPADVDEIRHALEVACFDESERIRLITAGTRRVQQFNWDRCARETAAVYRQVIHA